MTAKSKRKGWTRAELPIATSVARAKLDAYIVLQQAFNKRAQEGMNATQLADLLDRDKAQVSRLLNGAGQGMALDTLAAYLSALKHRLRLEADPIEDSPKRNWDARPDRNTAGHKKSSLLWGHANSTTPTAGATMIGNGQYAAAQTAASAFPSTPRQAVE